jgi:hypothetical protein
MDGVKDEIDYEFIDIEYSESNFQNDSENDKNFLNSKNLDGFGVEEEDKVHEDTDEETDN